MLTKTEIKLLVKENARRLKVLTEDFNPVTGLGSLVPRFELYIYPDTPVYLPMSMLSLPLIQSAVESKSLYQMADRVSRLYDQVHDEEEFAHIQKEFMVLRFDHDFEFWAYMCVKITDKDTGELIPFKLNRPQRMLLRDIEQERLSGKPIRIILTKARQYGGSTLVQVYFAWIQLRHKMGWNSVIVAHVENQARNIRSMYTKLADNYLPEALPDGEEKLRIEPFEGSPKTRTNKARNCLMDITSVEKPESTRSFDYALCHLSEVGLWRGTLLKKPEDLVQNMRAGVKKVPYSMIVIESTAKGVGTFFHREWTAAKNGKSSYRPVFIPWHSFDKYISYIDPKEYEEYFQRLNDDDWARWHQGATLEGIKWYNEYMASENYDKWRMESEFPGDDDEAFQSTGNTVFHRKHLLDLEKGCRPPEYKGSLTADQTKGKGALKNLSFEHQSTGLLWIWDWPDRDTLVKNRYLVSVDIGGTTEKADYSVIRVIDRYWLLHGGVPSTVATWRGHIDQDLLGWIAVQVAQFYNKALLVVESNSLRKDQLASDGEHFLTVLDEISEVYDNLYTRTSPEKVNEGAPVMYGFHTNIHTKQLVVDHYRAVIRDKGYIETDMRVVDECKSYQRAEDGRLGAVDGMNDDLVMATAIGMWICNSQMSPPAEYEDKTKPYTKNLSIKRKGATEAVI